MDQGALVKEEIEAGAELVREFNKYKPLTAAFWLKASDSDYRYLYLVSDDIDENSINAAYGEVVRLYNATSPEHLDLFRIKVVTPTRPLAEAVVKLFRNYPESAGKRYGGGVFGDVVADDLYIYPIEEVVASP